jgi:hypothetical protein
MSGRNMTNACFNAGQNVPGARDGGVVTSLTIFFDKLGAHQRCLTLFAITPKRAAISSKGPREPDPLREVIVPDT